MFYVWFDAPIGYVSITACYTEDWKQWWFNPENVDYVQFMAKDNVPFHSVVFPATQLGTGKNWTMVNHLMAVEYLNYESAKFSKSRGIGVFGNDAKDTDIPSDVWRFYLIYMRPENQDSAFKWDDLMIKVNSELLGNLGNFANRALKFCKEYFSGVISEMRLNSEDLEALTHISRLLSTYVDFMEATRQRESISLILSISRIGNVLMQNNKPWKLVKTGSSNDKARAASVVSLSCNIVALLSLLLEPFMPALAKALRKQLNFTKVLKLGKSFSCLLEPGHKIGSPEPLIAEIKSDAIKDLAKRFAGNQADRNKSKETGKSNLPRVDGPDPEKAKVLEVEVSKQGDVVRQLKASKADKDTLKPEIETLLELKKLFALAQGQCVQQNEQKAKAGKNKKK